MSSDREIIKEYKNGDLTIVWKPQKCIHAAECVKRLPEVYNPKEKPWIKAENASIDALKIQIKACPSGALSYKMKNDAIQEEAHLEIKQWDNGTKGAFHIEIEGKQEALMTYSHAGADKLIIDHTEVGEKLKGQGVGYKLVEAAVAYLRANNLKVIPLCPFAAAVFKKKGHEYDDVRA
jgi:predicted GNAT family acetyltransferase/uncharacterized Fe-S cluster protein YjdI